MDLTPVTDALHAVSQALTYPVIILLLALIAFAVFVVGTLIAETVSERRHFKLSMPAFLQALEAVPLGKTDDMVEESALLRRQKHALLTLLENRNLPEEPRFALAKRLVTDENEHYENIIGITDIVAKIGPMLGLMGTLIPLGPGILAMSSGDTVTLSSALLIAFDTTVAGLLVALVCLIVSRIRRKWYGNYMVSLEAAMTSLLDKIDESEEGGQGASTAEVARGHE